VDQLAMAPTTIQELNLSSAPAATRTCGSVTPIPVRRRRDPRPSRRTSRRFPRVFITRPETLQVMQRRRFSRFRPARSTQVELRWQKDEGSLHGTSRGFATSARTVWHASVERRIGEQLWIGDRITWSSRSRPVIESLCHRSFCAADTGRHRRQDDLGLQFVRSLVFENSQQATEKLRKHLQARLGMPSSQPKGADA